MSEGPQAWLWYVGTTRLAVLAVMFLGVYLLKDVDLVKEEKFGADYLWYFYLFGLASSLWYLLSLRRSGRATPLLTWAQVLVDFGVVAATVSFTGGPKSDFTFLFVVVILEAGLVLGLMRGYVFATLAVVVMFCLGIAQETYDNPDPGHIYVRWYNFVIQGLAYYLTASISGYWSLRVSRMQQFQREVLDNMNNGFIITDLRGIVTGQNRAADRILGLEEGITLGRPVQEVLRVEEGSECPIITALRAKRDFTRYEFRVRLEAGGEKLLGLSTSRISDSSGRVTHVIASFSDLTELAQMRQELQRQDRLAVVGELAAGLAHEIRNPVAAIRGSVEELKRAGEISELGRRLASIAIRESDHLNKIVTDFLDFARHPEVHRDLFDVHGLAEEVAALMRAEAGDGSAPSIAIRSDKGSHMASADRSQIKQVFVNIARNALEAMGDTGTLTITVGVDGNSVETRFDDEGPGFNPDELARVFEPFYTTKEAGVGMGLAVCERIVTANDGIIRAATRKGGGASMTVRLPASPKED
jgi:two-component system, NtrC family, sensor histidine kinase PilS